MARNFLAFKKPIFSRFFGGRLLMVPCALVLLGSSGLPVQAADTSVVAPLTLPQAIRKTLSQHPDMTVFAHRLEEVEGRIDQAGVGIRPELALEVEDALGTGDYQGVTSAQTTFRVGWLLQQEQLERRVATARLGRESLALEQEIRALDMSAITASLYIRALALEHRYQLSQLAESQQQETVERIRQRVQVGRAPMMELLQSQSRLAQRQLQREDLEHERTALAYQLTARWGEARPDVALAGDLFAVPSLPDADRWLTALRNSPLLRAFASEQRLLDARIAEARSEARPQWQINAGVRRYEASSDMALVAGVSLPWGEDRRVTGQTRSLRARQQQVALQAESEQRRLDTQLRVLVLELEHSQHSIDTLQQRILPDLEQARQQAGQAYESGKLDYVHWYAIQQQWLENRLALVSAYESLHLQWIQLQRLSGASLDF